MWIWMILGSCLLVAAVLVIIFSWGSIFHNAHLNRSIRNEQNGVKPLLALYFKYYPDGAPFMDSYENKRLQRYLTGNEVSVPRSIKQFAYSESIFKNAVWSAEDKQRFISLLRQYTADDPEAARHLDEMANDN